MADDDRDLKVILKETVADLRFVHRASSVMLIVFMAFELWIVIASFWRA